MVDWTTLGVASVSALCFYLLRRYMTGAVCSNGVLLTGKTVLITGANSGIGKAAAEILLRRNARVVMACRDVGAGEAAAMDVAAASGCDLASQLAVKRLDLASLKSVADFAEEFCRTETRLDVLICNAGVAFVEEEQKTEDGFEMQMGTNHLGHVALTERLLPMMTGAEAEAAVGEAEATEARIVFVSSTLYKGGRMDEALEDLNFEKSPYDPSRGYANSKLANILYARELSRRLSGSLGGGSGSGSIGSVSGSVGRPVRVFSLSPGIVKTNLGRHRPLSLPMKILLAPLAALFLRTPFQGAQTLVYCATAPELSAPAASGKFYRDCKEAPLKEGHQANDDQIASKLYDKSLSLVGLEGVKCATT